MSQSPDISGCADSDRSLRPGGRRLRRPALPRHPHRGRGLEPSRAAAAADLPDAGTGAPSPGSPGGSGLLPDRPADLQRPGARRQVSSCRRIQALNWLQQSGS